ncbi:uncharacterized protein CTRU02_207375 [Colletotrichum truncatum]|uniref:Uncharacterized protein n=1 Tax=Colletotrichum truncatum TaxID=5467 RepID=A0ACC3Z0M2_COLTU|nr:uncharacterized protein CTRU02_00990 [Colletotrichum truncatum]KAF6800585.1 hypothetical protein CTRU02_00990 [Colletotrichum truncatum]
MYKKPSLNTVVFRTPSWSRVDGSPTTVASPVVPWNPRDEVIRRFSDPAKEDDVQNAGSTYDKAETAYAKAVKSLQTLLKDEGATNILTSQNGKQELCDVAKQVQEAKETTLDQKKMQRFVRSLDHYQGVFDILSQADFSGLPLIWGGLKFILLVKDPSVHNPVVTYRFQMSKNSSEALSKVFEVIIDIGRSLERIRAYAKLYPIPRMTEFTTDLYEAIAEFLEKVIKDSKKSSIKRAMTDFLQPFDVRYGDLLAKMKKIQEEIKEDANVCLHVRHAMTSHSIARYQTVLPLQKHQMYQGFKAMAEDPSASLFAAIKKNLFQGFELEAGYHQELESTYKTTTSKAWVEWFKMEQRYVPSGYSHETKVIQAECDAPDPQHALIWKKQQRTLASNVPSAYLIWTRGMTAQSAIASLIDQILFQKTEVMVEAGLDLEQFREANNSPRALWNFFLYLTTVLGGCMVYITIGSVGDEEAAIVGKFVSMAKTWKGPAINVTLIHPFSDEFARTDDVINLDDKYDVHPSLTTTDAMHHVLVLELQDRKKVSNTIQDLLWETVWREVRYAVIGIALAQLIESIHHAAKAVAEKAKDTKKETSNQEENKESKRQITKKPFSDVDAKHWVAAISKWTGNEWSMNTLREQIQRHIDIVDIHLPPDIKSRLKKRLQRLVFMQEKELGSRQLTEAQRAAIWEDLQDAIRPGTSEMFCSQIETLLAAVLEEYWEESPEGEGQAKTLFVYLVKTYFGKSGRWKDTFSDDKELVAGGITTAIEIGFQDLIEALASQEDST